MLEGIHVKLHQGLVVRKLVMSGYKTLLTLVRHSSITVSVHDIYKVPKEISSLDVKIKPADYNDIKIMEVAFEGKDQQSQKHIIISSLL